VRPARHSTPVPSLAPASLDREIVGAAALELGLFGPA
jgi:hypothetical protein